jgi:hypothetical protein
LRFTRDKRGYETTSLVHAGRRNGRTRQRLLYWFRTPPGVKVGRPALDEQAIRWIEEHNPDIEFDWPKILEAQPPLVPATESGRPRDEARNRRPRRDRDRPPYAQQQRPAAPKEPEATTTAGPAIEPESLEPESEPETLEAQAAADALEELTHPDAEEEIDPPAIPAEQNLGREQLTRLRARYAEVLTRIVERGGDAERIEALRTQAESLNPDTWVTDDEVRQGIEAFEPKIRDLRAALGLRRRRRSRRGGRRRRGGGNGGSPLPADTPDSSSNEGE